MPHTSDVSRSAAVAQPAAEPEHCTSGHGRGCDNARLRGADHAGALPALPLRPFVSHYAGSRMCDVPQWQHAGLPSRYIDLIISLATPIEIVRMPGAQAPGAYRAFVAGLQQASALVRMGGDLDC